MASPIVISVLANASQANSTLNQTATLTQRVGGKFRAMELPAVAALGAIGVGAKQAIDAASDLSETVSKTGQVFGPQAKEIEKFAARAEQALGQSKTAALDAASTFGIIAQSAGLSGKAAADFSKQYVTLASDMASFNNTSPEEAVTAIGAAMRGEAEPIRKYGVLLDDATLRNRALKLGLIDSVKTALTPQQKALAASKEIMAQTTKAQGDFARTSDGAANKSRILAAQQENLKAKIGKGLLPVYIRLQGILATVLTFFSKHQTTAKILIGTVAALAAGVLLVNAAMAVAAAATATYNAITLISETIEKRRAASLLGTRVGLLALSVQTVATSAVTKAAAAAQWLLNAAMSANPIGLVVIAIVALVAAFIYAWKNSETFRTIVLAVFNAIRNGVMAAVNAVVGFVRSHWRLLLVILTGPIGAAALLIAANWGRITAGARNMYSGVRSALGNVVSYVKGIPGRIKNALGNLGGLLHGAGSAVIQGLIGGINAKVDELMNLAGSIANRVKDKIKGALKINSPAKVMIPLGSAIPEGLAVGIRDGEKYVTTVLGRVSRGISNTSIGQPNFGYGLDDKGKPDMFGSAPTQTVNHYYITVEVTDSMSPAEQGRKFAKAIKEYERTQGAGR